MKGNPEIKDRLTGKVIVEAGKYTNIREAVEKEFKRLSYANLRFANLSSADLSSADLSYADLSYADLSSANLRSADLSYANLRSANLSYANLRSADLSYANLSSADLRSANLRSADLRYADLSYAEYLLPDLYILKMIPPHTVLTAWKYIVNGKSPYQKSVYEVGKSYIEEDYCSDEQILCAKGLNVATLQWCLRDCREDNIELLEVQFKVSDIVSIPYSTDGNFRVKQLTILRKLTRKQAEKYLQGFVK